MIRAPHGHTRRLVGLPEPAQTTDRARSHPRWRAAGGIELDRVLLALVVGGWGITVAWLVTGVGDAGTQRAVADLGEFALDLLAAVIILRAALRVEARRIHLGWAVVGLNVTSVVGPTEVV